MSIGPGGVNPPDGTENSGSGGGGLGELASLSASAITTLVTIATRPEQWLAGIINKWVVGGILEGGAYVLGWIVFAYDRTASIIGGVAGPVASPFQIIEDAVVGAIETVYGVALATAHSAGLTGPPAAAFAVTLVTAALAVVVFAVWRALPVTEAIGGGLGALR